MSWAFDWFDGWEAVSEGPFRELWASAFKEGDRAARVSPYSHPLIFRAWAEAYGKDCFEPLGYVAHHPDGRTALQVLKRPKVDGYDIRKRALRTVGYDLFDYTEPVILPSASGDATLDEEFWQALWEALEARAAPYGGPRLDVLDVPRVRRSFLSAYGAGSAHDVAPYLRLDRYPHPDDYMSSRKRGFRRQLRRRQRRLMERGEVAFRIHRGDALKEVFEWIPTVVRLKDEKYELPTDEATFANYLSKLVEFGAPAGLVVPSSLMVGGQAISWSIDFSLGSTLYLHASSFDPAYSKYGIGNLHLEHLVRWAIAEKYEIVDFLWGDQKYKLDWTDGEHEQLVRISFRSRRPASVMRQMFSAGERKITRSLSLLKDRTAMRAGRGEG